MNQASPKIAPGREPETISAARTGNTEAFAALYNENRREVFRYIRSRVRDEHLAEDLTSETFLRALRRIETFTWRGASVGAWLVTIARNLIADHYKASRTRLELPAGDLLATDDIEESAEHAGLRELDVVEARNTVEAALSTIAPMQATCLRLRFFAELTVTETAAELDRSVGAVKTLTHRAKASMHARLAVAA
ncbi:MULTISPECIES: RNA polymerase sigma factor [Streptomyces]|uniref:RNA polymerase sigma factor n=1 Tax=Streptomyces flavovirens TaxID=52258 RepID=A0ABV8NBL0_9ACTN|nr:sigma-70 family RNA polymerase sigma factor [Streptomyces sp. MBT51]MBK3595770.1 sigma-70 family RNA polymerase sigma factor [Streptomyces sp. MBT51]